jgi:hypothetical protein
VRAHKGLDLPQALCQLAVVARKGHRRRRALPGRQRDAHVAATALGLDAMGTHAGAPHGTHCAGVRAAAGTNTMTRSDVVGVATPLNETFFGCINAGTCGPAAAAAAAAATAPPCPLAGCLRPLA